MSVLILNRRHAAVGAGGVPKSVALCKEGPELKNKIRGKGARREGQI